MRAMRATVVGRAWLMVCDACCKNAHWASADSARHSYAASAMPAAAAVKGPQLWVTMSVMACATC